MTIISIRQPGYLPYLGFFKKIQSSDIFVFLDDVQYERSGFDNRNKIKTVDGNMWLTVPVRNKFGQKLNQVIIIDSEWRSNHRLSIRTNYQKAPYFSKYWDTIDEILCSKWEKLLDLNLKLIQFFIKELRLNTKTILSSELQIELSGSEKLLEICKKLGAKTYMSGENGKQYLDQKIFADSKIKVIYEKFQHPIYRQINGNFISNMAIIDLLFNEGENSKDILLNSTNLDA